MKLAEINEPEIIFQRDEIVVYVVDNPLTEAMQVGFGQKKGGMIQKSLQGIGKFAKAHPWISSALALYAVDAVKNYKKNKRKTITFYTQDVVEKKLYSEIVDTLMTSGKYRKVKNTFVDGGWLWELKKLG